MVAQPAGPVGPTGADAPVKLPAGQPVQVEERAQMQWPVC
jgi:hypothetical protein